MTKILTNDELKKISLGYIWSPNMDFKKFASLNKRLSGDEVWNIYNLIESRYIEFRYENE